MIAVMQTKAHPVRISQKIGFITTCKGRLHHLKQTLPLMVAEKPDEIIVVDYDCPHGAGEWVETTYPTVKVRYIRDGSAFNVARARNLGIASSTADWLCLIDADILVQPGFVEATRQRISQRCFYRRAPVNGGFDLETFGTVICSRRSLDMIGGYDEVLEGWGGEDMDLYHRLRLVGDLEYGFPAHFVRAISHDDQERFEFDTIKDKVLKTIETKIYTEAKKMIMTLKNCRSDLPLQTKRTLHEAIRKEIAKCDEQAQMIVTVVLKDDGHFRLLNGKQRNMVTRLTLNFEVAPGCHD